ncbi:MAG TPA: succinate dehydrogenase iron-sulfur subunit [Candidatus Acidoferrum sp.]|nr:succinate dehydrogenase iron-sulfur subunit [Candidatus Acidoferrum sp.]
MRSMSALPLYISLMGTPVIMLLSVLSYLFYPAANAALLPLAAIGLLVFGVFGAREAYVKGGATSGIPINANVISQTLPEISQKGQKPGGKTKEITINVTRFNNSKAKMEKQPYKIKVDRFTTVLDGILQIKEKCDNTLSMRYSCRMGICGSCGVVINGKPSLACETNIMKSAKDDTIDVAPMQAHPLLKDLVNDFDDFFAKHSSVSPHLYKKDAKAQYAAKKEYAQTQDEVEKFLPYSYCIMCGLCMDACPVVNTNPGFIGPQALSQVQRYAADSRDDKGSKRIDEVNSIEGLWGCEFAGACSKVCPKGVDPATAIQLLKTEAMDRIIKDK